MYSAINESNVTVQVTEQLRAFIIKSREKIRGELYICINT